MPLDADKKRIIGHFYRFDQTVRGFSCGDQSICQSFDGLVMGTVDTDGICLTDGVESCTWDEKRKRSEMAVCGRLETPGLPGWEYPGIRFRPGRH